MSIVFYIALITDLFTALTGGREREAAPGQRLGASPSQRGRLWAPEWRDSGNVSPGGQGMEENCAPLHDERLLMDRYWRSLAPLHSRASPASSRFRITFAIPVKVGLSL